MHPVSAGRWGRFAGGGEGRGAAVGFTSCPLSPSFMLWSKSKRVNCIQGIWTSARVSRLLNVKVSATSRVPNSSGPCKLIWPKVGVPAAPGFNSLVALGTYGALAVVVSMYRSMTTPVVLVTR